MIALVVLMASALAFLSLGASAEHQKNELDTILLQAVGGSTLRSPQPRCIGLREQFETGYGGCEFYDPRRNNFQFCQRDMDDAQGLRADQVCSECKVCQEHQLPSKEAKAAAERKAQKEAELKAKAEAERKATEEAGRKAKADAERKVKEEAESKAKAERKAKEEAERKAKAEAVPKKARGKAEREAQAEAQPKAKIEAEHKAREEAEHKVKDKAELKAKAEAGHKSRAQISEERRAQKVVEAKAKKEAKRISDEANPVTKSEVARQRRNRKVVEEQARTVKEEKLPGAAEKEKAARTPKAAANLVTSSSGKTGSAAKAVGDPHLVNIYGQRFDIFKPGKHKLLQIPRYSSTTLLRVEADAKHMGSSCADMYFQSISVTGRWVMNLANSQGHGHFHAGSLNFDADSPDQNTTQWRRFGDSLDLKVIWGRTTCGIRYLNFLVRNLNRVKHHIGGLLGEDDHSDAATPRTECKRKISLLSIGSVIGSGSETVGGACQDVDQSGGSFARVVDA